MEPTQEVLRGRRTNFGVGEMLYLTHIGGGRVGSTQRYFGGRSQGGGAFHTSVAEGDRKTQFRYRKRRNLEKIRVFEQKKTIFDQKRQTLALWFHP